MGNEWRSATVSELQQAGVLLVEDGNHGEYRPRPDEFVDHGVAFIRAADMDSGRILFERASRINERARERITKGIGAPGDVLLSHKGTVGKVALVPDDAPPFVCSPQTTFWRTLNSAALDRKYLYAFLRSPCFHTQLATRSGETDMAPYVSLTSQRGLSLILPPIQVQRAIGYITATLDDKIELNRRMNETLEAMARALFKSWFVDFDPVRAKAEGRDPGLPKHLADLFPNRIEDSELGDIPRDWSVGTLGSLSQRPQYGYTASATEAAIGPKFLRITDINKLSWIEWALVPHCEISSQEFQQYSVNPGDILIARMADPGHGVMIEEDVEAVFASYLIRFRPLDDSFTRFTQYWLKSKAYWRLVNARRTGTTRASLNAQVLSAFQLIVPTQPVAAAFAEKISTIRAKVIANVAESHTLAAVRDALLPKLISGEIRIKDAKRIAGVA